MSEPLNNIRHAELANTIAGYIVSHKSAFNVHHEANDASRTLVDLDRKQDVVENNVSDITKAEGRYIKGKRFEVFISPDSARLTLTVAHDTQHTKIEEDSAIVKLLHDALKTEYSSASREMVHKNISLGTVVGNNKYVVRIDQLAAALNETKLESPTQPIAVEQVTGVNVALAQNTI